MKITRRQLRRLIEATIQFTDSEKEEIKKAKSNAVNNAVDGIARDLGVSNDAVASAAEKIDDEDESITEINLFEELEEDNTYE